MKKVLIALCAGAVVLAAGAAVVIGPRNIIGMLRYDQRKEVALRVGDPAPDVAVVAPDGTTPVALRDRMGQRPLVLIFGSFT